MAGAGAGTGDTKSKAKSSTSSDVDDSAGANVEADAITDTSADDNATIGLTPGRNFAHVTFSDVDSKNAALKFSRFIPSLMSSSSYKGNRAGSINDNNDDNNQGPFLRIREPSETSKREKAEKYSDEKKKRKKDEKIEKRKEAKIKRSDNLPTGFKNTKDIYQNKGKDGNKNRGGKDKSKSSGNKRSRDSADTNTNTTATNKKIKK